MIRIFSFACCLFTWLALDATAHASPLQKFRRRCASAVTGERKIGRYGDRELLAYVAAATDDFWGALLEDDAQSKPLTYASHRFHGRRRFGREAHYPPIRIRIFAARVKTSCGWMSEHAGMSYCPGEQAIYVPAAWLEKKSELIGEADWAYAIAHEVGHHVQNHLRLLHALDFRKMDARAVSRWKVRRELQADCLAGFWVRAAENDGLFEPGEVNRIRAILQTFGDEPLERASFHKASRTSYDHGDAAQRDRWFMAGYEARDLGACETYTRAFADL